MVGDTRILADNEIGEMVTPARLERATSGLEDERSIQLSYGATLQGARPEPHAANKRSGSAQTLPPIGKSAIYSSTFAASPYM